MIENSSYLKTEINNYMSDTKDVKVFLDTFEKLPKEIYDLEKLIYSNNISLNEIESKKVLLEKEEYSRVSSAVDKSDKPLFSNEEKRKTEVLLRLKEDDDYIELENTVKEKEQSIKNMQMTLSYMKMRYDSMKTLLRAI